MSIDLAKAERFHAEAVTEHTAAKAQAQKAADRLADVEARKSDITQRRLAGTARSDDVLEFFALTADADLLQKMLGVARQVEAVARDKLTQASQAVARAKADHDRTLTQAKFDALHAQCKAIEGVFCEALGELGRTGQALGISTFGGCFQKSDTLHRAFDLNVTPPKI